jgi:hypothetical protein
MFPTEDKLCKPSGKTMAMIASAVLHEHLNDRNCWLRLKHDHYIHDA